MDKKDFSSVYSDFDFVLKDMDDLDKQLAELQLINNTELPPNPTLQKPGGAAKKIAPVVPPKPKKPQPQVRNSFLFYYALFFSFIRNENLLLTPK